MFSTAPNTTTTALLEGLRDPSNEAIWREFDERYRGVLIAFGRRLGLGDADAADMAQETLTRFLQEYLSGKYDRSRGRLRSWLISIAKYRMADQCRVSAKRREYRGESVLGALPNDEQLTRIWDAELEQSLLGQAMAQLRRSTRIKPQTIEAFQCLLLEQATPATVAQDLDMTIQAVYMAKHHCLSKLKELVADLKAAYGED